MFMYRQSPSHLYPGRMLPEQEETLLESPPCNVYVRSAVKTQYYSVRDAILMHRESQQPAMFNHPKAPIRLRLELNMSTERSVSTFLFYPGFGIVLFKKICPFFGTLNLFYFECPFFSTNVLFCPFFDKNDKISKKRSF